ncbi:MAG TPA: ferritin-like domain-containing protein [Polyangiaceae bacterium]|nr:ferritin-like domain-containing protein [Polyangiaceae bacterium]
MRSSQINAWLLEAVAVGSLVSSGCTPKSATSESRATNPQLSGTAARVRSVPVQSVPSAAADAGGPAAPGRDVASGERAACVEGTRNVLLDLKPARAFDHAELRRQMGDSPTQPLLSVGKPCASASDIASCERELQRTPSTPGFAASCRPGHCNFQLVVSDAHGVTRLGSAADLAKLLAPVDTAGEAALLAFANNHWVLACDAPLPQRSGSGWTLTSNQTIEECPLVTADVTLAISEAGEVRVVRTENQKRTNACVGRRPPGLQPVASHSPPVRSERTALGAYLAGSAHLEAASVPAFERLADELAQRGAPKALSRACQRAAADERRHTRRMTELAVRRGGRVPAVEICQVAARDTLSLALDNAVEGCVRETFGAVVGRYQALHATDPEISAAMDQISRDELRHATLAWKIGAWLETHLAPAERTRVNAARGRAIEELRSELAEAATHESQEMLGLPSPAAALSMLAVLEETLWRPAA